MEKIVREYISTLINEAKITRSYTTPMSRDDIKNIIVKMLMRYKKDEIKIINSMSNWLSINNFGTYQHNRWIKAIVNTLFKYNGNVWTPINQNLSIDQLTDIVMNYWSKKLK